MTIFLVLKSGYIYEPKHVKALTLQLKKYLSEPPDVICLSDRPLDIPDIIVHKLQYNLPRQWSQIEILRPDLYPEEDIWYFDLDTKIIGSIDDILNRNMPDALLEDFFIPGLLRSGVMRITAESRMFLWNKFEKNRRDSFVMQHPTEEGVYSVSKGFWNRFFRHRTPLQSYFPDRFISFKKHCFMSDDAIVVPSKASVLCFHGLPKFKPMEADTKKKGKSE